MSGVLVTCFRGREAVSIKECYNLFDEYYSSDFDAKTQLNNEIEEQIEAELKEIRSKGKNKNFLSMGMGDLQCLIFIKINPSIVPSEFIRNILKSIWETKTKKSRFH